MHDEMTGSAPETDPAETQLDSPLVVFCAIAAARGDDFATFEAECMRDFDASAVDDPADDADIDPRVAMHCLLRALWKNMPHPAARFAVTPMKKLERNDLCHCGSGEKYKKCCSEFDAGLAFIDDNNHLRHLLEALPRERWKELVRSAVDIDAVVDTAQIWMDEDRDADARDLLAPWFVTDSVFKRRYLRLFDALAYAYDLLGESDAQQQLLDRGMRHGDAAIRGSVLRTRAAGAADANDLDAAWKYFDQARQVDRDAIGLISLEIELLMAEGNVDEAKTLAGDWLDRLEADGETGIDDLIDYLQTVLDFDPDAVEPDADTDPPAR
jgi:hypothetical protein